MPLYRTSKKKLIFLFVTILTSAWLFNLAGSRSATAAPDTEYEFVFYDEDWRQDWTVNASQTAGVFDQSDPDPAQNDNTKSSRMDSLSAWIQILTYEPHAYPDTSTFDTLELELWGWGDGTNNGQRLAVALANGGIFGAEVDIIDYTGTGIPADSWMQVSIPLADLAAPGGTFDTVVLMPEQQSAVDYDANTNGRWFAFDNVRLVKNDTSSNLSCATGELGGTVFFDGDSNGLWDRRERGVAGILVTAYSSTGSVVGTPQTTDGNGQYKINVPNGTDVRVEFTGLPTGYSPGALGSDSTSSVVFTTSNANCNVDFGVSVPDAYCESNPQLATSCYVSGDPLANGGTAANMDVLVSFDYDNEGKPLMSGGTENNPNHIAFGAEMGSTWGLAHQRDTDTLYASAMLKRHVGLGPAGPAGIYMVKSDGTVAEYVDLADFGISAGTDPRDGTTGNEPLPAIGTDPSNDVNAYSLVGKMAFGDIDIAADDTLWVVNLHDGNLYGIANANPDVAPTAGDILGGFPITAPGVSCSSGNLRPWAVKAHFDGLVYVGAVCSGENGGSEANLTAHVLSIDPNNTGAGFTQVFDFSLANKGGCVYADIAGTCGWNTWDSPYGTDGSTLFIYNPQPVFSDIEFDVDGSMILGFFDRAGHQFGVANYEPVAGNTTNWWGISGGDLVRVCNDSGTYVLESNGTCPGTLGTLGKDNGEGYGAGEFYQANFAKHQEVSQGGVALLFGTDEVAFTSMDPVDFNTSGVRWNSNTTGATVRAYEIVPSPDDAPGMQGKAAGLGDLELICEAAPLEVGNRLWCDNDGNGKQDAGENGVGAGVTVVLTCGGDSPVTVATTADGTYSFTDADYMVVNGTVIPRDAACTITIDTAANAAALAAACNTVEVTIPNNGAGAGLNADGNDLRDSDAVSLGDDLVGMSFVTGDAGENTHALDVGFGTTGSDPTLDYGDLPDNSVSGSTNFPTVDDDNGARHTVSSDLYLGSCVDADLDGQPDAEAGVDVIGGDDQIAGLAAGTCSEFDDEDGVTLLTPFVPGEEACVEVTATSATGTALLNGWIDFNGDGDFAGDANEKVTFTSVGGATVSTQDGLIANGTTTTEYCFEVPVGATFEGGETHMRFRASTNGGLNYDGAAADGEVEDYYTPLACVGNFVWDDTTGSQTGIQDAGDTPLNIDVRLLWAGANGVIETVATDVTPQGDDAYYTTTSASGVYQFCGLTPDNTYRIDVPNPPVGTPAVVTPGQGTETTDSDGSQGASGEAVSGPVFTIDDPISLTTGEDGTSDNPGGTNGFPDSSDDLVIDFGFTDTFVALDYGDLPDDTVSSAEYAFPTDAADSGAAHQIVDDTYLGSCVDGDAGGSPDEISGMGATGGDDNATGSPVRGTCTDNDDEDGVTLLTPMIAGNEACVSVTANVTALSYFDGWVDFDGDGTFVGDADENLTFVRANGVGGLNLANFPFSSSSSAELCFNVPVSATFDGGETHMRFRLSRNSSLSFNGVASEGEVEDYHAPLACAGNYVWSDVGTTPNVQDAGDSPLSGVGLRLVWAGSNGLLESSASDSTAQGDDVYYTTATAGDGTYSFCGLTPDGADAYRIDVPTPPGTLPAAVLAGSGTENTDSDGLQTNSGDPVQGIPFTVSDPVAQTLSENGNADNPGSLNGFPDANDELTIDFGFASTVVAKDFGDLPDSSVAGGNTFETTEGDSGPSHLIVSDLYLGSCVDAEGNGAPDATAGAGSSGGDDNAVGSNVRGTCVGGDDEDGVVLTTPLIPGNEACFEVTTTAPASAILNAWIDFDGNGSLADANEALDMTLDLGFPLPVGNSGPIEAGAGNTREFCFTVPANATFDGGETHMRFRLSTEGNLGYTGEAADGEVEDYYTPLACVGNYVWWEDISFGNNIQDGTDNGLGDLTVRLIHAGRDDVIQTTGSDGEAQGDDTIYTAVTSGQGTYAFCGLIPDAADTYQIDIPTVNPSFSSAVTPNVGETGGVDVTTDSDGIQSGAFAPVSGPTFTIADPISLALAENGNQDNPGSLNAPDARDDLRFDFGFAAGSTAVSLSSAETTTTSSTLLVILMAVLSGMSAVVVRRR